MIKYNNFLASLLKRHWLLIPFSLTTTFGFGYQVIPFFSWFFVPTVLAYTRKHSWKAFIPVYFVSSFSFSLGYIKTRQVSEQDSFINSAVIVTIASFLLNLILLIALATDSYLLKHSQCIYRRVFIFPLVWTSLWSISAAYGTLGDYGTFSASAIGYADLAQVASIGGRSLIDFLVATFGTVLLELDSFPVGILKTATEPATLLQESEEDQENDPQNTATSFCNCRLYKLFVHPAAIYGILIALVLSYGGYKTNIHAGSLFQKSYSQFLPTTETVGCVVGPGIDYPDMQLNNDIWFNKSTELAEAGSKLILWSELTTIVQDDQAEKLFLERAKEFSANYRVYLGIAYGKIEPVKMNKLVFITKEGKIGIDYNKAHPVPLVEDQPAGAPVLQYVDTEDFGRVGGAICFDYNFPSFISQASKHKVDLMLQPSWTWGPIGTYHEQTNILRPVENGFTLFRCVSQGVSGIHEPTLRGLFSQRVATINNEVHLFSLPIQKRVATVFGYIGDTFSYLCMIASVLLLADTYRTSKKQGSLAI